MSDIRDPDDKVVIRSDMRSTRIVEERELAYFGAPRREDDNLAAPVVSDPHGQTQAEATPTEGALVGEEAVQELDATIRAHAELMVSEDEQSDDDLHVANDNTI
ncbi:hypothetical protein KC19_VG070900 [Ceratodon purpureus]|uniref:Uncharacterized protein n=1 Tax=Ceratodon purpureus TaxID=3225 RepID=A0A8T0HMS4_CERPU|nr:hypothetical protein KC19_VG070900 [Ceratodon purpureus]